MSECYAVLIETVSIQDYIFQSNQLKEHIGASFLIDKVYRTYLTEAVEEVMGQSYDDIDAWQKETSPVLECTKPFDVGYIGGGNALLLFQKETVAEAFLETWTRSLLIKTPGITTAVALHQFDLTHFKESRKKLFQILRQHKAAYIPDTVLPMHGMTSECKYSGYSANIWNTRVKEYVSANTHAKIEASRVAQDAMAEEYHELLQGKFCFTNEIDQLGQREGEDSHIAIVHIDGNDMGERFKKSETLQKTRELSRTVKQATEAAYKALLNHVITNFDRIENEVYISQADGKQILPLRSIILGGDDITFVTDGKLGLYFASIFIKALQQQVSDGEPLTACAGVAITKTKYPFYRGYQLAEELCRNAKTQRKQDNDSSSYLDFHISAGGFTGLLEEIRQKQYVVAQGNLLFRPYRLTPKDDERSFELLVDNTKVLKKDFPRNKIYELRQVLTLSEASTQQFAQEMAFRQRGFPQMPGRGKTLNLFQASKTGKKTPYFDMIELLKLYPSFELQ